MEFKYKLLQEREGYKIVEFQHSFYNGLKKNLTKQSNTYFKMLNPAVGKKDMLTTVPTLYNHENVKLSMVMQNTIENEAVGIIVDNTEGNVVFDRIAAKINDASNDYCAIKVADVNLIICPDEINSVENLKQVIAKEVVKYNTNKLKSDKFTIANISVSEKDFIQDEIEEMLIEMIENDLEISEDLVLLTQMDLGKLVVNKKKMRDVQKLFELLGIANLLIENAFYFDKRTQKTVNEYVEKLFNNEISVADKIYTYDDEMQTTVSIETKAPEKHIFKYKDIDEYIESKTELAVKNEGFEWIEPEQLK